MSAWGWVLGGGGAAAVLGMVYSRRGKKSAGQQPRANEVDLSDVFGEDGFEKDRDIVRKLGAVGGLTQEQIDFFTFVALGESGWDPKFGMGDPSLFPKGAKVRTRLSEAAAARKAFKRNARHFKDCGHPGEHYSFGSGGLFAILPTYALYHLRDTPLRCGSPFLVFHAPFAMVAAYAYARSLTKNKLFRGTVASLRAGWWGPSKMDDPADYEVKVEKWRRQLEKSGLDPDWLGDQAPAFPERDLVRMYLDMGGRRFGSLRG